MRFSVVALAGIMAASGFAFAQEAPKPEHGTIATVIQEAKTIYGRQKTYVVAAAEKMPEANYNFKPTPEIRTYGELFTHIAQVQNMICDIIQGKTPPKRAAQPVTKAAIVAELKASFDNCDAANASVTAANAFDMVGKGFFHGTKVGLIGLNAAHDNEMYGTIAVYLRLKGIVPPSTAARTMKK